MRRLSICVVLVAAIMTCRKPGTSTDITTRQILAGEKKPLVVTLATPAGSVEGRAETFKILIGFNQPMTPLQAVPRDETHGPLLFDPPLAGKYRWLGSRTLAFIPRDTLAPASLFRVTLQHDKIQSLTGMQLERDTSWTFETVRPVMFSSSPWQGNDFVDCQKPIYLYFNIDMAPERVGDKIRIIASHGMPSYVSCGNKEPSYPPYQEDLKFKIRRLDAREKEEWPFKGWEIGRTLVLVPAKPLPPEAEIRVILEQGLMARQGNLGTDSERQLTFNTYNVFALTNYATEISGGHGLALCFSNPVALSEVVKHLEFLPPLDSIPACYKDETYEYTSHHLYLPFKLDAQYRVRVKKDLKDAYGNRLDRAYEFTLDVGDYDPAAWIPTGINVVEGQGARRLPATFVNADGVDLDMGLVGVDEAIPFLRGENVFGSCKPYAGPVFSVSRAWEVAAYRRFKNIRTTLPIELSEVLGTRKSGLVYVQMNDRVSTCPYHKAFLEVGDLGVTWKYAPENNVVWVTSLSRGEPVGNVLVQFRDDANSVLWQGYTGANGLCEFPGWAELGLGQRRYTYEDESEYAMESYSYYREPSFWVTASKTGDAAVYANDWGFGIDPWRFNIDYSWHVNPDEYGGYLYTEKGLYRAGETVHVNGIIRKKRKGSWIMPDSRSVSLSVTDARGDQVQSETLALNPFGAFNAAVPIAADAPTGVYSVQVRLVGRPPTFYESFHVEAYRPAEFEVKTTAERDTFIAGDDFRGRVSGRYLFGMPMPGARTEWSLYKDYYYLSYPKHVGYAIAVAEQDYDAGRGLLSSGSGRLDAQGELAVQAKLPRRELPAVSTVTLEGSVTAPNQRVLSGRQNWLVFPSNLLVGVKTTRYLYRSDEKVGVALIAIRPSGQPVAGKKIEYRIIKREWKSIKKARTGGRYEWTSELVEEEVQRGNAQSTADSVVVQFAPAAPGYYYVTAEVRDEKKRPCKSGSGFYVSGRGYAGWEMRDDDIIELVADRDQYEPGDTARILVKSPYDSARALVTVERELVMRSYTTKVRGNADIISIPITPADLPNVFVSVMLVRGRVAGLAWEADKEEDPGKPQFRIGYVNLRVDTRGKHLTVKTIPDRAEYRPRDSVAIAFDVLDHRERPVSSADVTLFVVDAGVLNLIDYRTPDPFAYFYGPRSLSVRTVESRLNVLGERSYGEKGEERGGGGMAGEGIAYREKFLSTVFFKANIRTDAAGRGKVRFQLPDNLTKFRIMAVVQTKNSEFGSAESTFTVGLPFMVTDAVPRFARVGDDFCAGVVLHNRTPHKQAATVTCSVTGLSVSGDMKRDVTLPANGSREVLFPVRADQAGSATFSFDARMDQERDALKLTIPVDLPPFTEAIATFAATADSALEGIIVPPNIHEDLGGLQVALSSTVLAGLQRGIEHLLDYPFGCLEQRLSRILPLIVGEEIINQFKLAPVTGKALRDTVQKALDEVADYQVYGGGFVYFKGGWIPSPYLTAYAMDVLSRARDRGYRIDQSLVSSAVEFMRQVLRWSSGDWTYPYNQHDELTTQAYCVYALSCWDAREPAYASRLFEERTQIPIFGKVLLLKAGRRLGMGASFESELARIIVNKIKLEQTSAHFEESESRGWTFLSPAKVTASVIQAFTALDLDFAYRDQVMRWIVSERGKRSKPTTHENAFVFDALETYYRKFEQEEPDFTARIIVDSKEILNQSFKGRTTAPPTQQTLGLADMPKNRLLPIRIIKDGAGRLYYTLRLIYALKESPIAFDEGFYVWKEILNMDDRPARKFRRGEVYKVVLHVVVSETRLFAAVDDPLPAGFEPVQTFFATEARQVQEEYWDDQGSEMGHWWGSFDHQESYDDRMLFFAQELFPGEHTQVYYVRAGTPGKFLAPASKAEEMYAPEIFGSTTQGYVVIE